ncbi:MAG: NAD-dependent epimerase/dehydratase family protein [Alphaproteobacteria bacterium]|nr:NAD-dependent epimerase/dehydratase family protein [Alphaproteobacteria bacterium]
MLRHSNAIPVPPRRVVVLGAGGFVGGAAARRLEAAGVEILRLGRPRLDLLADGAATALEAALRPDDALVVVSAQAPCKDAAMMVANLRMIEPVCAALARAPVAHVVYVSSDAVYRDAPLPLTEESCAEPGSAHGAMHRAREVLLADAARAPFAILRPTLIYGADDPHNGYGPNRFRRLAGEGKEIVLFGEGEERRDHVLVDDVAELLRLMLFHRSAGILNAATGAVASFRQVAEIVSGLAGGRSAIRGTPRQGPMPHGGYRPFDSAATQRAFPGFRYTPLAEGLALAHRQSQARGA